MKKLFFLVFLGIFSLCFTNVFADETEEDLFGSGGDEAFFAVEEQIVVSASKRAQKLSDAPVSISVITSEDIKMLGAQSIAEALRMVPGVYVQETTGGQQDVMIRGLGNGPKEGGAFSSYSRNILVMIDGRSYFNDIFGGTFWEFLPVTIDDIDRIEVVRGPASALFGANAVTGVINIITKDFKKTKGIHFSASVGNNGQQLHAVRFGKKGEKFSFRIGAEYSKKETFDDKSYNHTYSRYESNREALLASTPFDPNPDYPGVNDDSLKTVKMTAYFNYKINKDNSLNLQLGRSKGSANLPGTAGDFILVGYDNNIENNSIKLTYQCKGTKISLSNVFGQFGDEFTSNAPNDGNEQDGMNWNSYDIDIQTVFDLFEKDVMVAGVNWRYASSEGGDVFFRDDEKKEQKFGAAFFNNEYSFSDKLKWIIGMRFDKYDKPDKSELSPQSIIFYKPKENHTFRLIYSQAIRAPFIADLFTNAQFSAGNIVAGPDAGALAPIIRLMSNEDLDPMTIKSYELGYSTAFFKNLKMDLNLYHYETKDMIGYENVQNQDLTYVSLALPTDLNTCSAMDLKAVNLDGKFKTNGFELGLTYQPEKTFKLWGNYSYQNNKWRDKDYDALPSQLASVGGYKTWKNGWSFSASANYISASEVSITNVMDQTLAQINKDLVTDNANWMKQAANDTVATYLGIKTDYYKQTYKEVGGKAYKNLGGTVLNEATVAFLGGDTSLWTLGYTDEEASFFIALNKSINDTAYNLALGASRAANGVLYQESSKKENTEKVEDYIFFNIRLAKKFYNNNAEFSLLASLRPSRRQYAYGEETGNKYRMAISYKF